MVIIKDMDMPFNCDRCRLKDTRYHECKVKWKKLSLYDNSRPVWCPLVEVEPYGVDGLLYKEK